MAEQMRPASPQQAPDPSDSYERSHPGRESGMGRMDNNKAVPADAPDQNHEAVGNKQDPTRQINAQDVEQPDHSMKDEEPLGWDQAPTDIHDPTQQRHPRREGKGGVP